MPNQPISIEQFTQRRRENSSAPVSASSSPQPISIDQFVKATSTRRTQPTEQQPNMLGQMAKGLLSAPATMIARPIQLGYELLKPGDNTEELDRFSREKLGGLVAPVPQNLGDVKKDIGRGLQTVALGTGAPIAGGALFGAGTSLEQGNDLLSKETAMSTATGGVGGKVLQVAGKPIINTLGGAISKVSPTSLNEAVARGVKSAQKTMANTQLLGGVAAPLSQKIATGLQGVDDAITGGVSKATTGAQEAFLKQYPNASPTKHYTDINKKDFLRPTTVNEAKYNKATAIYNDAKGRGVNLEDVASRKGVIVDKLNDGGVYNTIDEADKIRQQSYSAHNDFYKPALKAAEPGVQKVPVSVVRDRMLQYIDSLPDNVISAEQRETMRKTVMKRYADNSPAARRYKDGYSLTNIDDARIVSGKNGKYKPGADPAATLQATLSREEARMFRKMLDEALPDDLPAQTFRREQEESFLLADYLESLSGKKVPENIVGKSSRLFAKAAAATVGGKIGGFPGSILGSQYGDMLFSGFETIPNPIKMKFLESIKVKQPDAYKALIDYLGADRLRQIQTLKLPSAGESGFKEQGARLFTTPGGKSTTNKQEAVDIASIEAGKTKLDKNSPYYKAKVKEINERLEPYFTEDEMAIIQMGPKPPKRDYGVPTVDTPPKVYTNIKNELERYLTPDEMAIIEWGPTPKKRVFKGKTIDIDE